MSKFKKGIFNQHFDNLPKQNNLVSLLIYDYWLTIKPNNLSCSPWKCNSMFFVSGLEAQCTLILVSSTYLLCLQFDEFLHITSVTQKSWPSTVVIYYCAWSAFLRNRRYLFSRKIMIKYKIPCGNSASCIIITVCISCFFYLPHSFQVCA